MFTALQMLQHAQSLGLRGAEVDWRQVPADRDGLRSLRRYIEENGLYLAIDASGYDPDVLGARLRIAREVGAVCVRTVVGGAGFGGDRRPMQGRWQPFMQEVLAGLAAAAKVAAEAQVPLAVENHQDLASEELLWLCGQIGSPWFGVALDTGNPLSVAEEPVTFTRAILPYLKNVHLKDYWIYPSDSGYRLVRCPIGKGAVPLAAMLAVVRGYYPEMTCAVEVGAHHARHVRLLEDDFWPEYAPRTAAQLARTVKFYLTHAQPPHERWETPLEQGAGLDEIVAYEQVQLQESLPFAHSLLA